MDCSISDFTCFSPHTRLGRILTQDPFPGISGNNFSMYSSILNLACGFPKRSTNTGMEALNFEAGFEFICGTALLHNGKPGINRVYACRRFPRKC